MPDFFDLINAGEDRRVRKTKKALRNSLFSLLKTKSVNQITVTELSEMADINRSTFYIYYTDVFDMVEKIQEEIYSVFLVSIVLFKGNINDLDDFIKYCTRFLDFCKDNFELCRFVTRNDCNNQLAERIKKAVRDVVPDSEKVFNPKDPRYYLTTFALSGMLSTILQWMDDGMLISSEDMAKFLVTTYVLGAYNQKESDYYKNYSFFK